MIINLLLNLLAMLASILVFGFIVIAAAFVIFIVGCVLKGMYDGFTKSGGDK